ncbi:MAG: hypothetical protein KDI71_15930 [Xanthomonadales bacterium]|nr:hypothetical protein [Xanthomonadales bacterium]
MSEQPQTPSPAPATSVALQVLGSIMVVAGVLLAALSGLCSGWMILMSAGNSGGIDQLLQMALMVLMVGGTPFAIGIGLIFGGRTVYRSGSGR